jgi:hypothetical protein
MGSLLQTLVSLPSTLDATYARILQQIDEYEKPHVRRILQWMCFSARPLYLEELAEVHRIGGKIRPPFSLSDDLFHPEDILGICPGFLLVSEESRSGKSVFQFAHFSAKEYLLSPRAGPWWLNLTESHVAIVRASIACYLDSVSREQVYKLGNESLNTRISKYPLARYAVSKISYHLDSIIPREHPDLIESFQALLNPRTAALSVHGLGASLIIGDDYYWDVTHVYLPHYAAAEVMSLTVASALGLPRLIRKHGCKAHC